MVLGTWRRVVEVVLIMLASLALVHAPQLALPLPFQVIVHGKQFLIKLGVLFQAPFRTSQVTQ